MSQLRCCNLIIFGYAGTDTQVVFQANQEIYGGDSRAILSKMHIMCNVMRRVPGSKHWGKNEPNVALRLKHHRLPLKITMVVSSVFIMVTDAFISSNMMTVSVYISVQQWIRHYIWVLHPNGVLPKQVANLVKRMSVHGLLEHWVPVILVSIRIKSIEFEQWVGT